MMDNQSGADLVLIGQERHGNEEKQWKVNQGQMFAPPVMEVNNNYVIFVKFIDILALI